MYDKNKEVNILIGDTRTTLKEVPDSSVNCIVTSPPYYNLRSYLDNEPPDKANEIGMEDNPEKYIDSLVSVFTECYRVLTDDGVMFVNIGDTYNGTKKHNDDKHKHSQEFIDKQSMINKKKYDGAKSKDLLGIPFMLAFALRDAGWYWRDTIIWAKATSGLHIHGTCMPESVKDRCNKAHEYILMFSKNPKYYYNWEAIAEKQAKCSLVRARATNHTSKRKNNGDYQYTIDTGNQTKYYEKLCKKIDENPNVEIVRTRRSVWTMKSSNSRVGHFAVYPPELAKTCILCGCPKGGTVLDPFGGSGTTSAVAIRLGCKAIHCELNSNAVELFEQRCIEVDKFMNIYETKSTQQMKAKVLW